MIDRMAIIGGGFSGTLQAINLLRHHGPAATLIERADSAGKGLAYGAAHPSHLLNVRAGNMSALPDDPDHFVRWLAARGHAGPAAAFVPRTVYGDYLAELLDDARRRAAGRLELVRGDVVDLAVTRDQVDVRFGDGRRLRVDAAVIAVGNLPPHDPPGLDASALAPGRYWPDPWAPGAADGLGDEDTVLIIGSGLTMVDVALMLEAQGFGGRIVALSRRGLAPHRHEAGGGAWEALRERPRGPVSALLRSVRRRAQAVGWRNAVDELRPFAQAIWANADRDERARFLRHLRPWWDVHRHRLAPSVAQRVDALERRGRLRVVAGRTLGFRESDGGVEVTWRPRGEGEPRAIRVRRIINCTGPQGDLARTREPLLRALVERGAIRPDAAHLGIDVDSLARVVGADGTPNDRLFALGPMTRGAFWEIVAVPDIRTQAWNLARWLSHAHWVEGEGL